MPLTAGALVGAFAGIFEAKSPSGVLVAQQLAAAYASYASLALAQTAVPCLMMSPGNVGALEAALAPPMLSPQASSIPFLSGWVAGLPAFWSTASFQGPPISPSVVPTLASPGCVQLPGVSAVLSALGAPQASASAAAGLLASALHTATVSAVVIFANAPPGVLL